MSSSGAGPFQYGFNISANDSVNLPNTTKSVLAITSGTVNAVFLVKNPTVNTPNVTFAVTAGYMYPISLTKVYSTGTSATLLGLV